MNLSEMRTILSELDLQLTKSLGQNFLHDGNQLRRIVTAAEVRRGDRVLEIGPGLGPLTEVLLANADEVLAIEKDARLVEFLRQRFRPESLSRHPVLTLVHDDALRYLNREQRDWSDWKLVANLPYSVASPILVDLSRGCRRPKRITVTLQLEVARRLTATEQSKDYGILTLLVQLGYEPKDLFKIPAGCFFPEPGVDSACVTLERRTIELLPDDQFQIFARVVKRAFSERRKMMLKLLKRDWPHDILAAAFGELHIPLDARAETVSLLRFAELTRMLSGKAVKPIAAAPGNSISIYGG